MRTMLIRLAVTALAIVVPAAAAAATFTLADFDGTNTGSLSGGGSLGVAAIGTGDCAGFTSIAGASGSALCGNDTDESGGADILTFTGVDFAAYDFLDFTLGVRSTADFEDDDVIEILANGSVNIATFTGDEDASTGSSDNFEFESGLATSTTLEQATFTSFSVPTSSFATSSGTLSFSFLTSTSSEFVALDSVQLRTMTPVPLPGAAVLLLAGLATFGFLRRARA
jgi:hypothetical protein